MIDKMYIILKEFQHEPVNIEKLTKNILKSYGKKHSTTEVRRDTDAITTWIKELARDGKISTKYNGKHYPSLQRAIEAIWNSRTGEQETFVEKTVGNLGFENTSTRNNEIFDIQWSVLTNEDTMSKMFNPGSFDVQKKSAAIIKALKEETKYSYSELAEMSLEELESLSSSNTDNIIFSTTQVAFHKQNMTAGKLIGVFANSNTSHAFLSMQSINLNLKPTKGFTIDGHTVQNYSNNTLDRQNAFNGTLISKNIAGFLAASVDAVKDPVLNFMNLNTFTVNPAMLLARLGFDSDIIGLIMTQPIIEQTTRDYFRMNNEGYVSVEDIVSMELDTIYSKWRTLEGGLIEEDFTREKLANSIKKGNPYTDDQVKVLLLFKRLSGIAKDLNTLTFLTKFNSVTNAAGPTIADTLVLRERFNKFIDLMSGENPPFSNNAIHVIDNSPILSAFYESTVGDSGASKLIFEPYFPQYSEKFTELLSLMRRTTKAQLDSKTINKLMNDFILYKLTLGNNPIINSSFEQRDRFINKFVKEFSKRAEGLVDNELIRIISIKSSDRKCPVSTLEAKASGFSIDIQERIKAAWSDLMSNPDTFELGRDLFIYNLYRNGFNYSPKTFLHLASVDTKLAMGDYIDSISDPEFNDDNVSISDFLLMFRRNHSEEDKIVPSLKLENNKKNTRISATNTGRGIHQITISYTKEKEGLSSIIADKKTTSVVFSPVIRYNGKLYYTEDYEIRGSSGSVTYTEIAPLGHKNNFLEYNANEDAVTMKSVLSKKKMSDPAKKDSTLSEPVDKEPASRTDEHINYDANNSNLTDEDLAAIYGEEAFLSRYRNEVIDILKTKGEKAMTERTLELLEKTVSETKSKIVKKKAEDILNRFCSRK